MHHRSTVRSIISIHHQNLWIFIFIQKSDTVMCGQFYIKKDKIPIQASNFNGFSFDFYLFTEYGHFLF